MKVKTKYCYFDDEISIIDPAAELIDEMTKRERKRRLKEWLRRIIRIGRR